MFDCVDYFFCESVLVLLYDTFSFENEAFCKSVVFGVDK